MRKINRLLGVIFRIFFIYDYKSFFVLLVICFLSCNSDQATSTTKSEEDKNIDSVQQNSLNKIDKSRIMGIWTNGDSESASFDIKKDSIFYVDVLESYKYELEDNVLRIFYPTFTYEAKVNFLKDTMV